MIERVFYSVKGDVSSLLEEFKDDLRDDRASHDEDEAVNAALHVRHLSLQAAQPLLGHRPELGGGYPGSRIAAAVVGAVTEAGQGAL
jgi:hypothetical protein